jgi:hypothetical protein
VDRSLVFVNPTYIPSQLVGGLVLGIGFIIGGYCPGTSIVGVATGRLDALVFILGTIGGIFVFGEFYPLIEGFVNASALGRVTISEALNIRTGQVVFAVVLMAVLGFWGASAVERKMLAKSRED